MAMKTCVECGALFKDPGWNGGTQRFCGKSCSATWRMRQPSVRAKVFTKERGEKISEGLQRGMLANPQRAAEVASRSSARMKTNNPMNDPVTRAKATDALKGRTFLSRGGNGQLTKPQILLAEATGLPTEYSISTLGVGHRFQSVPTNYKVDLAHPETKLAIEVDGKTHLTKRWRFLDARKTTILRAQGWQVLRFWNEEVNEDLETVVLKIRSCIALRSQIITTSSLTEF